MDSSYSFGFLFDVRIVDFVRHIPRMTIQADSHAAEHFAEGYDEYADAIFRHCLFRVFDREKAKELMQDTFMKTWEYIAAGNDIDNVQAFLYRTANNLVVDFIRRRVKRTEESFEDMQDAGFDIVGEDGRDQGREMDAARVAAILHQVEEPYRTALVMRYVDEMKPKEIAEMLGETANVISVRINRGLKMLRSLLPQYG